LSPTFPATKPPAAATKPPAATTPIDYPLFSRHQTASCGLARGTDMTRLEDDQALELVIENEVSPLVQVFDIVSTDAGGIGTLKIKTQYDKSTMKNVVYWTDLQDFSELWSQHGRALYLKDTCGNVAEFLKDDLDEE
jgi:hypothetical protein